MTLLQRLLLYATPLVLIGIGTIGWMSLSTARDTATSRTIDQLSQAAGNQVERLNDLLRHDRERVNLIASRTELLQLTAGVNEASAFSDGMQASRTLDHARTSIPGIQSLSVYLPDGTPFAQSYAGPDNGPQLIGVDFASIAEKLDNDELTTDIIETGSGQYLRIAKWLMQDERQIGVLVTVLSIKPYIRAVESGRKKTNTGETLLAYRAANGDAVFIGQVRFSDAAKKYTRIRSGRTEIPVSRALSGELGFVDDAVDYRGQPVFAVTHYFTEAGWGVVTKIDRDEALAQFDRLTTITLASIFASGLLALLAMAIAASSVTRPLRKLTQRVARLAERDNSPILPLRNNNELEALESAFEQMEQRIIDEQQRLENEIVASTKGLSKANLQLQEANDALVETARIAAENEARLKLAISVSIGGYWEWSADNPDYTWLSFHAMRMLGIEGSNQLIPQKELLSLLDKEHVAALYELGAKEFVTTQQLDMEIRPGNPRIVAQWLRIHGASVLDATGNWIRIAGTITDISARKRSEQEVKNLLDELQQKATIDSLTGLANRRHLNEVLDAELSRAKRHAPLPVTIVTIDVDNFKAVNDTHGHLTGDDVLAGLGQCLHDICRPPDMPARFGGEEFMVLLPETDIHGALIFAERVRESMEAMRIKNRHGEFVKITVSLGVAQWAPDEPIAEFLDRCDKALYKAKENGRNRIEQAPMPPGAVIITAADSSKH